MNTKSRRSAYGRYPVARKPQRPVYRKNTMEDSGSFLELVLMQCIVCGIILALALIVCVVKVPQTENIRHNLKAALGENISEENIAESPSVLTGFVRSVTTSVRGFFGTKEELPAPEPYQNGESIPVFSEISPVNEPTNSDTDFRIDEDILDILESSGLTLREDAEKKPLVP